ncbi:hypothetical protein GCM10027181_29660 [Rheinheimera gaetbuli]
MFRPDPIIENVFQELTPDSHYTVLEQYHVKHEFEQRGNLGAMYSCLREYKWSSKRKPKSPNDVAIGKWLKLKLLNYVLRMKISEGEAYMIEFTEVDNKGNEVESSNSYSVNCDLSLLNS